MFKCMWSFEPNRYALLFTVCAILSLSVPSSSIGQTLFGDPTLTSGTVGLGKIELGGGLTTGQELKEKSTSVELTTASQNVSLAVPATKTKIDTEYFILSASIGLGKTSDFFVKAGLTKIDQPYKGDYGFSGGGGFRISPPQSGAIKIGLLVQAQYFSSEGDESPAMPGGSGTTSTGSGASYYGYGNLHEKITMTRYDALLGFGGNVTPSLRPYAGLLFTVLNGTHEATLTGTGQISYVGTGVITPISSFTYKRNFQNDSSIGGVVGITLNPSENVGAAIEFEFAPNEKGGGLSVFSRF
jgi:hypothetical protein